MKTSERRYGEDCIPMVGDTVRQSGTELEWTLQTAEPVMCEVRRHDPVAKEDITALVETHSLILVERPEIVAIPAEIVAAHREMAKELAPEPVVVPSPRRRRGQA